MEAKEAQPEQVMVDIADATEKAVQQAMKDFGLSKIDSLKYANYERIAKSFLDPREYIIRAVFQRRIDHLISPHLLLLTNKKVILLNPSYSDLHLGTNFFGATDVDSILYSAIKDIKLQMGRILATIILRVQVYAKSDITIHGLDHKEAKLIRSVIESIMEQTIQA